MKIVGLTETFGSSDEYDSKEVLHFKGGITKFAQQMLVFSSVSARDRFEDVSLEWIRPSNKLLRAENLLLQEMVRRMGGRTFLAVHYRRGKPFLESPVPQDP